MGKRWFKYFIGYINHFDGNDIKPVSKLVDKVYIICAWKKKHGDILQYTYLKYEIRIKILIEKILTLKYFTIMNI